MLLVAFIASSAIPLLAETLERILQFKNNIPIDVACVRCMTSTVLFPRNRQLSHGPCPSGAVPHRKPNANLSQEMRQLHRRSTQAFVMTPLMMDHGRSGCIGARLASPSPFTDLQRRLGGCTSMESIMRIAQSRKVASEYLERTRGEESAGGTRREG